MFLDGTNIHINSFTNGVDGLPGSNILTLVGSLILFSAIRIGDTFRKLLLTTMAGNYTVGNSGYGVGKGLFMVIGVLIGKIKLLTMTSGMQTCML